MRRRLAAVSLCALLVAGGGCSHLETVSPPGVDLSGTWQLDPRRSDAPPPPPRPRDSARVDASGAVRFDGPAPPLPMVSATRMTIAQDHRSMGIDYPDQPYRDVKWGEQQRDLYVVDAGWDQGRLIIETKSRPLTVRETYSLSDGGDTLTLLVDLNGRHGDRHVTRVFTRVVDSSQRAH